jgi:phospholipase/lecithinase/hemolysin
MDRGLSCRALALLGILLASVSARAGDFSSLVDFGDSISDAGNTFLTTGQPPSPPYFQGRASDGPVWVERLAPLLGVPVPTASLKGGTDFAFYGAQTTGGTLPSIQQQIQNYLTTAAPTATQLFTIQGGADDFAGGQLDPTKPADALRDDIQTLVTHGAKHILVMNLPPLGLTPAYRGTPLQGAATLLGNAFNVELSKDLDALRTANPAVTISLLDVNDLLQKVIANPAAFGFTNVTDPALSGNPPMVAPDADQHLFWDTGHPTSTGHQLLAESAAAVVPEPIALGLLGLAACGLLTRGRRRFPALRAGQ